MIFDKLRILRMLTPTRRAAHRLATRWVSAAENDPALVEDVIRLSGILAQRPKRFDAGVEVVEPIDATRVLIDRGRQELGQELLALMSINAFELSQLTEQNHDTD